MPPADEAFGVPPAAPALPPGHALYQMAMGHFVPRALALATKLGAPTYGSGFHNTEILLAPAVGLSDPQL